MIAGKKDYDYGGRLSKILKTEYPQLAKNQVYADHAGSTVPAKSLIEAHAAILTTHLLGNPHSQSPSSLLCSKMLEETRYNVMAMFDASAEHFDLIFVPNATGGIKLVGEAMSEEMEYVYVQDAHTSLVGLRELVCSARCLSTTDAEKFLETANLEHSEGVFAYPAQSNFNGKRLPYEWCKKLRDANSTWYSLLDASSYATVSHLSLADPHSAPDFTVVSLHKIFGYPDLGALLVRKTAARFFDRRKYFGGGTVSSLGAGVSPAYHQKRSDLYSRLEDGTVAFHSICALTPAIDCHRSLFIDFDTITKHTMNLAQMFRSLLLSLRHFNGVKVAEILTDGDYADFSTQGPIVTFNLFRHDRSYVGYAEFEKLASVHNIHIRTGGLCNPGGVESWLGLNTADKMRHFKAGHVCWDDFDMENGRLLGSIRASFGAMSSPDDVDALFSFIRSYYVQESPPFPTTVAPSSFKTVLQSLALYPIKSCHAYPIPPRTHWPVTSQGLLFDRTFFVLNLASHRPLTMKVYPNLTFITPSIDLDALTMTVTCSTVSNAIHVDLNEFEKYSKSEQVSTRVCSDRISAEIFMDEDIVSFFTKAIGIPCSLARMLPSSQKRYLKENEYEAEKRVELSLANESPFLLISAQSLGVLQSTSDELFDQSVFRANITIGDSSLAAFAEEQWKCIKIGNVEFEVSQRAGNYQPNLGPGYRKMSTLLYDLR